MFKPDTYQPKGDKQNSEFFQAYLHKIYNYRQKSGLEQNIGLLDHFVIQVAPNTAGDYICELLLSIPYDYIESFKTEHFIFHVLRYSTDTPDILIREPLDDTDRDVIHLNLLNPKSAATPQVRYIGEVFQCQDLTELYNQLHHTQSILFESKPSELKPGEVLWTQPSIFTHNHYGYILDSQSKQYRRSENYQFSADIKARFKLAKDMFNNYDLHKYVLPVDHFATRLYCHDREHAILEFLTLSPYYFWGAYNIGDQNSSTNVCRHINTSSELHSPAKVFTANNTPFYTNHIDQLPSPTENFVRAYGRRLHHIAFAVRDGFIGPEENNYRNVDFVVDQLKKAQMKFLDHVIGSCDEGLKQIFSEKSKYSLLITEYIQRCDNFDGFFTKENVAALTKAAGEDDLIT
jgi:hypothetical protein